MMTEKEFHISLIFLLCSQGVINLAQAVTAAEMIIGSEQ